LLIEEAAPTTLPLFPNSSWERECLAMPKMRFHAARVPNIPIGNASVLETLFPPLAMASALRIKGGRKVSPRATKRSFGDKDIPNQEIGNERKNE